jgi:hypothetical protein
MTRFTPDTNEHFRQKGATPIWQIPLVIKIIKTAKRIALCYDVREGYILMAVDIKINKLTIRSLAALYG